MTYVSDHDLWGAGGHGVATLAPSLGDMFVVTTLFGRQVIVQPVAEYESAVRLAHAFARRIVHSQPVTVKVLCLSLHEAMGLGLAPKDLFAKQTPLDEATMRAAAINACRNALRNCADVRVRTDALELLTNLGELPS